MAGLTGSERVYDSGIESSVAVLPEPPAFWSYSALKETETCPLRYALSRASYPNLWDRPGYPRAPTVAALFGDVVHGTLDVIVKALAAAGCESPRSAAAVQVLRGMGGYAAVAEQVLEARLAQFDSNPRVDHDRRRRLARELGDRIPEVRAQVQSYLSRTTLVPRRDVAQVQPATGESEDSTESPAFGRRRAPIGMHPELTLASEDLTLMGRVDLLTVRPDHAEILEYKTGAEDPSHQEQLRIYALLWDQDRVVNPDQIPVGQLTAAYPAHELTIPAPDAEGLRRLEELVRDRIQSAAAELAAASPKAVLGKHCASCPVRNLCGDYWSKMVPEPTSVRVGTWFDLEGRIVRRNGAKSWAVRTTQGRAADVLVRTASSAAFFPIGRTVRILGIRRIVDPDEPNSLIAAHGNSTETFLLADV